MLPPGDVCWACYEQMCNDLCNLILECYMSKDGKIRRNWKFRDFCVQIENSAIYTNFCEKSRNRGKLQALPIFVTRAILSDVVAQQCGSSNNGRC
jgi:hypothetical protein